MITFEQNSLRQDAWVEYLESFKVHNMPPPKASAGADRQPSAFELVPTRSDNPLEAYIWRTKLICTIVAVSKDDYEKLYKYVDYGEVFEAYTLFTAKKIG